MSVRKEMSRQRITIMYCEGRRDVKLTHRVLAADPPQEIEQPKGADRPVVLVLFPGGETSKADEKVEELVDRVEEGRDGAEEGCLSSGADEHISKRSDEVDWRSTGN